MTVEDLNLDAMTVEELREFASTFIGHGVRPIKAARELFPAMPKGYVDATRDLRNYAWNKLTAMNLRLQGDINTALTYEAICDRIYEDLPDWARGW